MEGGNIEMSSIEAAAERYFNLIRAANAEEVTGGAEFTGVGSKHGSETPSDESYSPPPLTPVKEGFSFEQCQVFSSIYEPENIARGIELGLNFRFPSNDSNGSVLDGHYNNASSSNVHLGPEFAGFSDVNPFGPHGSAIPPVPSNGNHSGLQSPFEYQYHHRNRVGEDREYVATPSPQVPRGGGTSSTYPTPQLIDCFGHFGACIFGSRPTPGNMFDNDHPTNEMMFDTQYHTHGNAFNVQHPTHGNSLNAHYPVYENSFSAEPPIHSNMFNDHAPASVASAHDRHEMSFRSCFSDEVNPGRPSDAQTGHGVSLRSSPKDGGNHSRPTYAQVVAATNPSSQEAPRPSRASSRLSDSFWTLPEALTMSRTAISSSTTLVNSEPRVSFDSNVSGLSTRPNSGDIININIKNRRTNAFSHGGLGPVYHEGSKTNPPIFDPWPGYGNNVVQTRNEKEDAGLEKTFGVQIDRDDELSAAVTINEPEVANGGVPKVPNPFGYRPPRKYICSRAGFESITG